MKKHKLFLIVVTALLIVATLEVTSPPLAAAPQAFHQQGDNAHPQGIGCIFAILIMVIGIVIIWGLWQLCKKIPPPPPPNDGQPTNITVAIQVKGPDTFMQFQFDPTTLNTNSAYLAGGNVQDEVGNVYQVMCSYALQCASNAEGPWTLDALVTNWMGGTVTTSSNQASVSLTNQEIALYDTNGQLLAARRWALTDDSLSNAIMPKIVMPPMHLPKEFYRLVLLEQ